MVWCGQLSSDSRHYGQGGAPHWIVIIKQHDITHSQAELSLLHHSVWLDSIKTLFGFRMKRFLRLCRKWKQQIFPMFDVQ